MNPAAPKAISQLRTWTLVEGASFLVLLFVAMPLKYFAELPIAVKVVGMAHGVLFIIVGVLLLRAMVVAKWTLGRGALVFVSALLPFGPFVMDKRMRRYEADVRREA